MLTVGVTGGIGTGKSTLARILGESGATVIDADAIGRTALEPGRPAWHSVVDQFGDDILVAGSMEIDRKRLARIVFSAPERLAALNAIVHPVIFDGIADTLEMLRLTDEIVVIDAALIVGTALEKAVDVLVVVDARDDVRKRRLALERGMSMTEIESRIEAQLPRARLLESADVVVVNDGSVEHLRREAARIWEELKRRKDEA